MSEHKMVTFCVGEVFSLDILFYRRRGPSDRSPALANVLRLPRYQSPQGGEARRNMRELMEVLNKTHNIFSGLDRILDFVHQFLHQIHSEAPLFVVR